jgi:hypothetical protein
MKAHGLLERNEERYRYRLTDKGTKAALMFVLFHQRVCGPLANSLFHHRPEENHKPASKIETAYYKAGSCYPASARSTRCVNATRKILRDEFSDWTMLETSGPPSAVILKSADGGQSWNAIDNGIPPDSSIRSLVVGPTTPSIIYAIALLGHNGPPGSAILRSMDAGESWNAINTGLPSGAVVLSLIVDPKDSSTIYLAVLFPTAKAGGILKSTDGRGPLDHIRH